MDYARLPQGLAISLGLASAEPDYACRVRGAQIAAIVRLSPLAVVASSLIGVILLVNFQGAGLLDVPLIIWGCTLCVISLNYWRCWYQSRRHGASGRPASRKAVWRAVLHGGIFGMLWGAVPLLTYAKAPASVQLLVGCVTAGMMCAGGFMLATVPLAGIVYIAMLLTCATIAILGMGIGCAHLGLLALLWVYAAIVVVCLCSNADLFVQHFLAGERLQAEIRARERAQAETAQAQRMSALGALAGGVAHDINNILQSVSGNATLLARRTADPQQSRVLAGSILAATERGGAITQRLLAFARLDTLSAEPVAIGAILEGAAELLEHTLHRSIHLGVHAPLDLPLVLVDKAQLESVLVNLAANAQDAMPQGGTLSFHAAAEMVEAGDTNLPLAPGPYVRLAVVDSGTGMDAATLARAAEPFFTTKPKGRGTGLGLAMARNFAEHSGGGLEIASEPGLGTVVTLWLPQTQMGLPARAPLVARPALRGATSGRVLVVDDDSDVRASLVQVLEDAGFDAVGVASAAIARDLVERGLPIDLIITDFAMPGINGVALLQDVQAMRAGLPAILLTGHASEVGDGGSARFVLLRKPVRPHFLLQHVWQQLAGQLAGEVG